MPLCVSPVALKSSRVGGLKLTLIRALNRHSAAIRRRVIKLNRGGKWEWRFLTSRGAATPENHIYAVISTRQAGDSGLTHAAGDLGARGRLLLAAEIILPIDGPLRPAASA